MMRNLTQGLSIWTPCTLAWGSAASSLPTSVRLSTMQGICTTCFCHSQESWLPSQQLDQFTREKSPTTICVGQLSNRVWIAVHKRREPITILLSLDTALWTITSQIINWLRMSFLIHLLSISINHIVTPWLKMVLMRDLQTISHHFSLGIQFHHTRVNSWRSTLTILRWFHILKTCSPPTGTPWGSSLHQAKTLKLGGGSNLEHSIFS